MFFFINLKFLDLTLLCVRQYHLLYFLIESIRRDSHMSWEYHIFIISYVTLVSDNYYHVSLILEHYITVILVSYKSNNHILF